MWKLVLENSNHPTKSIVIMKSSCYPLLKYLAWQLYDAFKKYEYKCWLVYIQSCDGGEIVPVNDISIIADVKQG